MKITDPVAVLALDMYRIWYKAYCEQDPAGPAGREVNAPSMRTCLDRAAAAIAEINKA